MLTVVQVVTLMLVAFAMVPAVAHALEYPGKKRLPKDTYMEVQRIYYPGFTFAGVLEGLSMVSALILVLVTPRESPSFLLSLSALILLLVMHAVYWVVTAPVNKVWLKGHELSKAGTAFFGMRSDAGPSKETDWISLRNRWEYSHIVRAALVTVALALLVCALALGQR